VKARRVFTSWPSFTLWVMLLAGRPAVHMGYSGWGGQ
jgi:hypothetical protein